MFAAELSAPYLTDMFARGLAETESVYGDAESYDGGTVSIDYRILNYGIWTLYLILIVEFVRHSIDHAAHGRPFYTAVTTMVFSELATLGIVEFGLFLWGKYGYIDKENKARFADVHFALFFTAIFNAFQYGLTSVVSTRFSNMMWVKTEQLELDHYVEIREEYDRVNTLIAERYSGMCQKYFLFAFQPRLKRRRESLRVQVKFHELRLHFLECNNLPFNLRVSDYLKRSELSILIGLVHVSGATWVILIGLTNLGYFALGMIGYTSPYPDTIQTILVLIFFGVDVFFIALSVALRWKMYRIFQRVMKTEIMETSDHEQGIRNQQRLFWFGSPTLVISMIQLMNFGYALSLSIMIIYWEYLRNVPVVPPALFPAMTLGCYIIFLYNLSTLLPEYTLCTSLGYLTNQKELQETVAMHRLKEAKIQQRREMVETATPTDKTVFQRSNALDANNSVVQEENQNLISQPNSILNNMAVEKPSMLVSDLVKLETKELRESLPMKSRESLLSREQRIRQRRLNRKRAVSDGVAAMRAWNQGQEAKVSAAKERGKQKPRTRLMKTTSQPGVIQGWQKLTISEEQGKVSRSSDDLDLRRLKKESGRRKSMSDPRIIQAWKDPSDLGDDKEPIKLSFHSREDGPTFTSKGAKIALGDDDVVPNWKRERMNRLASRKKTRKKTQSASAVIQSWRDYSVNELPRVSGNDLKSYDLRGLSSDDGSEDMKLVSRKFNNDWTSRVPPTSRGEIHLDTLEEVSHRDQLSIRGAKSSNEESTSVIDLSETVILEGEKKAFHENGDNGDDSDETLDTDKSMGNLSDVDVIHAENVGMVSERNRVPRTGIKKTCCNIQWSHKARMYFVGSLYPTISHVLGTSLVFYLVGHRVEFMLTKAKNDDIKSPFHDVTWFWMEAILFFCFLVVDFMILGLFPFWKINKKPDRQLVLATLLDIVIVSIVMALFFVAEVQRCCIEEVNGLETEKSPRTIGGDYAFESECTCSQLGTRTYGGVGIIEPFTSLILLRLFRFQFSNFFITAYDKILRKEALDDLKKTDSPCLKNTENEADFTHIHDFERAQRSGTALELWERAMAEFPDVVENYGQFSGEILQAMLGLKITPSASDNGKEEKNQDDMNLPIPENLDTHIQLAGSRHAKLPARAQALVIAGYLGKPVKPMQSEVLQDEELSPPTTLTDNNTTFGLVEFEVDSELDRLEQETIYTFVAPFARLVRSMRRCDRRHFPLLKSWMCVDVVMTQFEIVYFEAVDSVYCDLDEKTKMHSEACRLVLTSTRGGKGLRLCDVARGRKVVGHVDFANVKEIHVEKDDTPISDLSLIENSISLFNKEYDLDVEYWSSCCPASERNMEYARMIRWNLCEEDRLKIATESGTLFFRFYSDLAQFETHNTGTNTNCHGIKTDIAFQWAKTISRVCGRDQLQQELAHFGEENEAELRDYLEVVHFHEKEAERDSNATKRKGIHKRIRSMVDLTEIAITPRELPEKKSDRSLVKGKHRSSKSMMDFRDVAKYRQNRSKANVSTTGNHNHDV